MASKTTLNAANLENLGAAHLAALLMDISEGNANAKRRLRLELAGSESPAKLTNEIRKRLSAIGNSTANVGWRTLKGFRSDLNTQRRLIVEKVLMDAPADAADLMWQFLGLGDAVVERSSDASGGVVEVFANACEDLGTILTRAKLSPDLWLDKLIDAILTNAYGQYDKLVCVVAPLLEASALDRLRTKLVAAAKEPLVSSPLKPRTAKRWRKRVLAASESLRKRSRADQLRVALLAIADAMGDVDAYIALMADVYLPAVAAQIAERLLKAERPSDALKALDGARLSARFIMPDAWIAARIAVYVALGRKDEAQALRLDRFRQTLNAEYLRAYLKRLPDFDDIDAEDAALDSAKEFADANVALNLLIRWPSLDRAAEMVQKRVAELDGNNAEALTFAADRLSSRYPFAAMLLHRHIVEASLLSIREQAHVSAALPYLEAESLAKHIDVYGKFDTHDIWFRKLEKAYARRAAFWKALP